MEKEFINLNGTVTSRDAARLPPDNGAFRYGYGLFETMLLRQGQIELAGYHWERLFGGLEQLGFQLPTHFSGNFLEAEILKTAEKNAADPLCRVRLQVFADGGVFNSTRLLPQFLIETFPLPPAVLELNTEGLRLDIAEGLCKSNDALAGLKSCNALIYAVAARQAMAKNLDDVLLPNSSGHIVESSIANVFLIKNDSIYTPAVSEGCVVGVMRRHVINKLKTKGFTVVETVCSLADIVAADEVFLTNAIRRIKWIGRVGDKEYQHISVTEIHKKLFS